MCTVCLISLCSSFGGTSSSIASEQVGGELACIIIAHIPAR